MSQAELASAVGDLTSEFAKYRRKHVLESQWKAGTAQLTKEFTQKIAPVEKKVNNFQKILDPISKSTQESKAFKAALQGFDLFKKNAAPLLTKLAPIAASAAKIFAVLSIVSTILDAAVNVGTILTLGNRIDYLDAENARQDAALAALTGQVGGARKVNESQQVTLNSLEGKVKNLNDIAAEARSNASKALIAGAKADGKISNLNNIAAEARSNASKSLLAIAAISIKLALLNNIAAQANSNASKALINQNGINAKLTQLNNIAAQANSNASKALMGNSQLQTTINGLRQQLTTISNSVSSTVNNQINNLRSTITQAQTRANEALQKANEAARRALTPGPKGDPGRDGSPGRDGRPGAVGARGLTGSPGRDGRPGAVGSPGRDGVPGRDGSPGRDGKDAPAPDLNGINNRIKNLEDIKLSCRYSPVIDNQINAKTSRMLGILEALNFASNAAQMALLNVINNKLGAQVKGGISGKLGSMTKIAKKTYDFLQLGRVLNVLTYIAVLHNAYQLSSALEQTLFSALDNALTLFGINTIDDDGKEIPISTRSIAGKWLDNAFKSVFGVSEVNGFRKLGRNIQGFTPPPPIL